jgi:hypothetical protein
VVLCKAATAEKRTRNVLLPDERGVQFLQQFFIAL